MDIKIANTGYNSYEIIIDKSNMDVETSAILDMVFSKKLNKICWDIQISPNSIKFCCESQALPYICAYLKKIIG